MIQIKPFNPEDPEIRSNVAHILMCKPVKNLTEAEVLTTLRLLQLHCMLKDGEYRYICVCINDKRLELLPDEDKFLAVLLDCDLREVLMNTKSLIRRFGGTAYHWRKIARQCPITDTASAVSECGTGYYGRGWLIAPHICTLRRWIIQHSDNPEINSLRF